MDDATKTMIANLEAKTGVTVAEWTTRIGRSGLAKHGELVSWLK